MTWTARKTGCAALLEEARAIGDLSSITYSLGHLVHISLWRGQLARARAYADEHVELSIYGELGGQETQANCNLGLVMAYQGNLDDADRVLSSVLDDPSDERMVPHIARTRPSDSSRSRASDAGRRGPLYRPLA